MHTWQPQAPSEGSYTLRTTKRQLSRPTGIEAAVLLACILAGAIPVDAGEALEVVSISPAPRTISAPVDSTISVTFNQAINPDSIVAPESFWAFGRWSGTVQGSFAFSDDNHTVTLVPNKPFSAGESVMVILSHDIVAADGTPARPGGYSWQFWTNARLAQMQWQQIDVIDVTNGQPVGTRAYGGIASDLNNDGFLDITVVNEDTADLRVFLNMADQSGLFGNMLTPPSPVGDRASPSEPSDFNRDGFVDICVANIDDNTVSVLLGSGDGSYASPQIIDVGSAPRGIAVLDADGDGDIDIVNTNSAFAGDMSLMLNDGTGVFSDPIFFEGGGNGEWALAAADMNGDLVIDLVIGARNSQEILVNLGVGDGTFAQHSTQAALGQPWMLVCGDVDGDDNEDVAVVNGNSAAEGTILRGDGTGSLLPGTGYTVPDGFVLATDLGDLDGDGDLDWVTSAFNFGSGGSWSMLRNNGQGVFSITSTIDAPSSGSCALLFDGDNDGDLDMGLIDEISDVVVLMQNSGTAAPPGDPDHDCDIDLDDAAGLGDCLVGPGTCAGAACRVFDLTDDCRVDLADVAKFSAAFTGANGSLYGCVPQ